MQGIVGAFILFGNRLESACPSSKTVGVLVTLLFTLLPLSLCYSLTLLSLDVLTLTSIIDIYCANGTVSCSVL